MTLTDSLCLTVQPVTNPRLLQRGRGVPRDVQAHGLMLPTNHAETAG